MAAAAKNNSDLNKLYENIFEVQKSQESKSSRFLSILEEELNHLEFRNISNLKFENGTTGLNLKLDSFGNLLDMFVDVINLLKISNKDEIFLRIKNLFKKKIIDFSKFINIVSGNIMSNSNHSNKRKTIYDLLRLQNQLNEIYDIYERQLKNSNKSARNLIKEHNKNIRNKYKIFD
jgi:predicted RNA-binding protein with EMAP domain